MLTKQQQKWLDHLNDRDQIVIKPYDLKSEEIFEEVKEKIIDYLGDENAVLHRGASYLKISGQDEIDIYIPVKPEIFDSTVDKMKEGFGDPKSLYPLVRARFRVGGYDKHIDVFVINKEDTGWVDSELFTEYLVSHPKALDDYRRLKESGEGLSTREYYKRKIVFINEVLDKAKKAC